MLLHDTNMYASGMCMQTPKIGLSDAGLATKEEVLLATVAHASQCARNWCSAPVYLSLKCVCIGVSSCTAYYILHTTYYTAVVCLNKLSRKIILNCRHI